MTKTIQTSVKKFNMEFRDNKEGSYGLFILGDTFPMIGDLALIDCEIVAHALEIAYLTGRVDGKNK